ncbi:hypothetical protein OUZ56_032866 [Daphnia magna]|uniref:Uncharacterized protein n=1 Tax=Daphnia magna TaxID=35525 RepID=A0ABR0B9T3_9CRUS|nr:hypothetical protein OUZ56_032866 [Daphnia magna]
MECPVGQVHQLETPTERLADPQGTGINIPCVPNLAEPTVVPSPTRNDMRRATGSAAITGSPQFSPETSVPSSSVQINLVSRLEVVRDSYQRQGFSNQVVQLLLGGLRSSSQASYQSS